MKLYLSLIKKTFKRNHKLYTIKNEATLLYLISLVSYFVTPLFIILKIKPNTITLLNFILAITSLSFIFQISNESFKIGLILYFIFRVLDFCDGNVARQTNQTSFYGRFLDSILDIFYESFLILSIGFYCFKQFDNEEIFFLSIVSSVFAIYSTCIHDKYASLVRWMNEENNTKFIPYLRKKYLARLGFVLNDFNNLMIITLLVLDKNSDIFLIVAMLFFMSFILTSLINLSKHFFSARTVFRFKAKDKKTYKK